MLAFAFKTFLSSFFGECLFVNVKMENDCFFFKIKIKPSRFLCTHLKWHGLYFVVSRSSSWFQWFFLFEILTSKLYFFYSTLTCTIFGTCCSSSAKKIINFYLIAGCWSKCCIRWMIGLTVCLFLHLRNFLTFYWELTLVITYLTGLKFKHLSLSFFSSLIVNELLFLFL